MLALHWIASERTLVSHNRICILPLRSSISELSFYSALCSMVTILYCTALDTLVLIENNLVLRLQLIQAHETLLFSLN